VTDAERMTEALREYKQMLADKPAMSHRELARHEQELYALSTVESRRAVDASLGGDRRCSIGDWLAMFVDPKHRLNAKMRSAIYLRGDVAGPIWDLVDGPEGVSVRAGARLLHESKTLAATSQHSLEEAIGIVVSTYLRAPIMALPDGRRTRRGFKPPQAQPQPHDALARQPQPQAPPAQPPPRAHRRGAGRSNNSGESRSAFAEVRQVMAKLVRDRLAGEGPGMPGPTVLAAMREVDVELEAFFASVNRTIARAENVLNGIVESPLSRRALNEAFRLLNMEPPRTRDKINMKEVLRQKQRMAAAYHPDTHGGDRSMEPKFKEVIEAFETIKQYVNQQQQP